MQNFGGNSVFYFSCILLIIWLMVASTMRSPAAVSTKLYPLGELNSVEGHLLQLQLAQVQGVNEALVIAAERIACLKVNMQGFDKEAVEQLVLKGA
jgi:hypothetical protein